MNWQAGDLALCICDKWGTRGRPNVPLPRRGCMYTVREVDTDPFGELGFWLHEFAGTEWSDGFSADHFIKVTPDKDLIEREAPPPRVREPA